MENISKFKNSMLVFVGILITAINSYAQTNAEICKYALEKTNGLVPDLCDILNSNPEIGKLWNVAYRSRHTRIVSGWALAGVGLIFTGIGVYNLDNRIENCKEEIIDGSSNGCEKGSPAAPFIAVGSISFLSGILFWVLPNSNLDVALRKTKNISIKSRQVTDGSNNEIVDSTLKIPKLEKNCDEIVDRVLQYECKRRQRK